MTQSGLIFWRRASLFVGHSPALEDAPSSRLAHRQNLRALLWHLISVRCLVNQRVSCGVAILAFSCLLAGCQAPVRQPPPPPAANLSQAIRNNSCSLLHQLLDQEKDVSLLRFIKRENVDLKALLKRVSAAAKAGAVKLEAFAKADASLPLQDYRLPPGEEKTRAEIKSRQKKQLLHESGARLEFTLLLSQVEALNYASALARVAAETDSQPERSRYLLALGAEMENLRDEVEKRLALSAVSLGSSR